MRFPGLFGDRQVKSRLLHITRFAGTVEEDHARLREFRTLLEHRLGSNAGDIADNPEYWRARWKVMAIQGEYRNGLDECEGMLKQAKTPGARAILVEEAAKLLVLRIVRFRKESKWRNMFHLQDKQLPLL